MDTKINNYFYSCYIPYYKKFHINYPKIKLVKKKQEYLNEPDLYNWIDNGFQDKLYQSLYKTSYKNFYKISNFMDIYINLNYDRYLDYKKDLYYNFFGDKNYLNTLINIFIYYLIDYLPVSNMCYLSAKNEKNNITYYNKIKITNKNPINIDLDIKYDKSLYNLIMISSNIPINNRWGLSEYIQQQELFKSIIYTFQTLKQNGTLILELQSTYSNLTLEFITLLSSSFDYMNILKLPYHKISNTRYIILSNFKNNISDLLLKKLIITSKKWNNIEPSFGFKLNIKNRNLKHIYSNLKNFNKNDTYKFLNTINIKINDDIKQKLKNISYDINSEIINYINFIEDIIELYSVSKISINKILEYNCNHSLNFIKTYSLNFTLNKDVKKLLTLNLNKYYFPLYNINKKFININNILIDPEKFNITDEGKYSVTHPVDANLISNLIISLFSNKYTILDGTANVGGNSISFAKYFKKVISIELNKKNYNVLKNNISLFNFKNIELIHGNTLDYLDKLDYDILFLDPPWGGTNYKKMGVLDLKLGSKFIREIILEIKNKNKTGIVLKLPKNFRLTKDYLVGNNLQIYRIRNYYCAAIRL